MVHREQGAVRRRGREHVGQPRELGVGEVAVVVAGDAGVQRHDPQPVHLVHPVLRPVVVGAEQARAYGARSSWLPIVHTTTAPIASAAGSTRAAQPLVGRGLRLVGEVAGHDERLRGRVDGGEPRQGPGEPGLGVDRAVLQPPPASRCGSDRWAIACRGAGCWPSCFTVPRLAPDLVAGEAGGRVSVPAAPVR